MISAVSIRDFITGLAITRKLVLDYAVKRPRDFLFSDSKPLTFVEEVTQDEDDELSEEMWHEAEDETEDVCQSVSEEQDDSDENEHTDDFDLLDDESEECEQMLEERKAIFSILQKRKKNIGARLKRLLCSCHMQMKCCF